MGENHRKRQNGEEMKVDIATSNDGAFDEEAGDMATAMALKESLNEGGTKNEDDQYSLKSEHYEMDVNEKDESAFKIKTEKKRKIDEVDYEFAPEKVKDESEVANVGSIEENLTRMKKRNRRKRSMQLLLHLRSESRMSKKT